MKKSQVEEKKIYYIKKLIQNERVVSGYSYNHRNPKTIHHYSFKKVIYIYIYIYRERERERERDYFEILKFIILFYLHYFQSYDHKNILKNTLFFYIILQQFITNTISGPTTNPPPQFTF